MRVIAKQTLFSFFHGKRRSQKSEGLGTVFSVYPNLKKGGKEQKKRRLFLLLAYDLCVELSDIREAVTRSRK